MILKLIIIIIKFNFFLSRKKKDLRKIKQTNITKQKISDLNIQFRIIKRKVLKKKTNKKKNSREYRKKNRGNYKQVDF
jgi:hypothetical protein